MNKLFFINLLLVLATNTQAAQDPMVCTPELKQGRGAFALEGLMQIPIEDLMQIPMFLSASQQGVCTREAASIVSTITGEELLNRGARDLVDALELIPGVSFGSNMTNSVSMGIRGMRADGGKLSIFLDGVILTEQRFGTSLFGGHFPVDQIDRIEIVRGPGSILYGNFAELGVVNIITKKGDQLDGGVIGGSYGRFERGEAGKNTFLTAGKQWDDFEVSLYAKYNDSHRSDRFYHDAPNVSLGETGGSFDMANYNQSESILGSFQFRYKDFSLHFLVDEYTVDSGDGFANLITLPTYEIRNQFSTYALNLDYQHRLNKTVQLGGSFNYSSQTPWKRSNLNHDGRANTLEESVSVEHYTFDLKSTFSLDDGHYVVVGNSFQFQDYQHDVSNYTGELPLFGDYTLYGEGVYKTQWANVLFALRFDWYTEYGTNVAPRFALTKQFEQFHYKVMYSQAFHTPTGGNYQLTEEYNQTYDKTDLRNHPRSQINPETTHTYEIELGYQFQPNLDVTANIFYIEIQDYFLYSFDAQLNDFYVNSGKLSTWGLEAILSYQHPRWGKLDMNYSLYQAVEDTSRNFKAVDSAGNIIHQASNLGLPSHKVTANHTFPITNSISFNHTLIFSGERYGYSGSELKHYKPTWIYNMYLRYQDVMVKGLEVGLGLYDVFNSQYQYIQLSNGQHPALPGNTREVRFKFSYRF